MPSYGNKSMKVFDTLCPELQAILSAVIQHVDNTLIYGYRGPVEQNSLFASGASTKRFPDSKHNVFPSDAVDVAPWPIPEDWGDLRAKAVNMRDMQWKERVKFYQLLAVIQYEAARQGIEVRVGSDWDGDGDYRDQTFDDLVHVEVARR